MAEHKVYVLRRADGLVKIGTTTDMKSRLRALSKAHGPLEVVRLLEGDKRRERQLHHQYRQHRQFGEWFLLTREMLAELAALPDGDVLSVTATEARVAWEDAERAMAVLATRKVGELIDYRCARRGTTKAQAIDELSKVYSMPVSFLTHLHRRKAATVSAHGLAAIRAALRQEMTEFLAELEAEMAEVEADDTEALAKRAAVDPRGKVTRSFTDADEHADQSQGWGI